MSIFNAVKPRVQQVPLVAMIALLGGSPLQVRAADLNQEEQAAIAEPPAFDEGRFGGVRQKLSDWNVFIGVGAMYAPKYEGSEELEVSPIPVISATFGERVSIDPGGLAVTIYNANDFKFDLKAGYEPGRSEDDSDHLRGMGDVDAGGVIGATAAYELGPAELYASIDKTIGGSEGLVGRFGANVSHQYEKFIFSAGVSATVADENHMQSYFGVTSAQSASSGLSAYDAGAGLKRYDVEASVTYMATENWMIRGQAGVGFLTGDAADSPVVQDDVQPSAMLIVGYKF